MDNKNIATPEHNIHMQAKQTDQDRIADLEAKLRLIPVSEPPKENGKYLVWSRVGSMSVREGFTIKPFRNGRFMEGDWEKVTHWWDPSALTTGGDTDG